MWKTGIIKTTIVGGALFLLPIVVLIFLVRKTLDYGYKIAEPIVEILPVKSFLGIAIVDFLVIFGILIVCYIAGLAAKIELLRNRSARLEDLLVSAVPGYSLAKTFATSFASAEDALGNMKPILVRLDDMYQIAFEVEQTPMGFVVAYLPDAPNPWSGSVVYVAGERVGNLDIKPAEAIRLIRLLGRGTGKFPDAFRHADSADSA
ncbi:MAG: hypothetical protein ACR2PG_02110 [Hyphomicrobiaceae bacterium]